ncbi:MAG: hypothetical protein DCC58_06565 [Chloroflexi bacterium]|nr:MAG: hypothetical protein DCC58_06565 [Chloroflexota bacterium]
MSTATAAGWLGLTPSELAALSAAEPAGACFCKHQIDATTVAESPLAELIDCLQLAFPTPAAARAWLHTPQARLAGQRPLDTLRAGEVEQVLEALRVGAPPSS